MVESRFYGVTPFAHPTIMMRKKVYDALGGYRVGHKNMRAEDLDLWIRFFEAGYKGYNIQEVLYRYHESSIIIVRVWKTKLSG